MKEEKWKQEMIEDFTKRINEPIPPLFSPLLDEFNNEVGMLIAYNEDKNPLELLLLLQIGATEEMVKDIGLYGWDKVKSLFEWYKTKDKKELEMLHTHYLIDKKEKEIAELKQSLTKEA